MLKGVLPMEDVEKARGLIFDWFEGLGSGIKRDDVSTWKSSAWPGVHKLGFLATRGGGQTAASWFIRSHPNVTKAFKDVWRTEAEPDPAMLTSMDNFLCWRPWMSDSRPQKANGTQESWKPRVENLHVD